MPLIDKAVANGSVHITWSLPAGPVRAWEHLVDTARWPEWLGEPQVADLRVGGRVVVEHGPGYACESVVTRLEPRSRLCMTWEFPDEPRTALSLLVVPGHESDRSTLVLSHTGLGELTSSYILGWLTHLLFLDASVEGDPLPMVSFWAIYRTTTKVYEDGATGRESFTASRTIPAPRETVWEFIADPDLHHLFDSTRMVGSLASARPRAVGDVFTMNMTYRAQLRHPRRVLRRRRPEAPVERRHDAQARSARASKRSSRSR